MIKLFAYFTNVNACCVARQLPPTFQKISITVRNKGKFETDYPVTLIVTLPWWRKTKTSRELYPLWIHCFTKVFPLWAIFTTSITTAEATEHYLCIVTIRHAVNEIFETGVFKKKTKTNKYCHKRNQGRKTKLLCNISTDSVCDKFAIGPN